MRELIANGANVNEANKSGVTPLMKAAFNGHFEMVLLLLKHGVQVDAQTNPYSHPVYYYKTGERTALDFAAEKGYLDIAELLLQYGADINKNSFDGFTPLMRAAEQGHKELVEMLVKKGADLNEQSYRGESALILALGRIGAFHDDSKRYVEIAQILIDHDADVNLQENFDGRTALMYAARRGNLALVKMLVEKGADPKVRLKINWVGGKVTYDGYNALDLAKEAGHTEIENLLQMVS